MSLQKIENWDEHLDVNIKHYAYILAVLSLTLVYTFYMSFIIIKSLCAR